MFRLEADRQCIGFHHRYAISHEPAIVGIDGYGTASAARKEDEE